jgi:hypothetical protein
MRYLLCRLEVTHCQLHLPGACGRLAAGDSGRHTLVMSGTVALEPAAWDPKAEEEK